MLNALLFCASKELVLGRLPEVELALLKVLCDVVRELLLAALLEELTVVRELLDVPREASSD